MPSTPTQYDFVLFTDITAVTIGWSKYAGAYKIASDARLAGYTTQVINSYSYFTIDQLKALVDKFVSNSTLLIGISCSINAKEIGGRYYYWGMLETEVNELVAYIKSVNPNVKFIAGGPRVYDHFSWDFIDYSVIGKGDKAIVAVLDHLKHGNNLQYKQLDHTKVIYDSYYPYTQSDFEKSVIHYTANDVVFQGEALPIEIARGCIFSCSFCKFDLIGKKPGDWTKTADTLKQELLRNYELFGTTHYIVSDELINESVDKLKMLCDVVHSLPFNLEYTGYARADLLWRYPEMRELFMESGAKALIFGLETLHPKAGKAIGKGLDPEKIKQALHYCREKWYDNILMSSNFIIGLPHEPPEHIWETFEYLLSDNTPLDLFTYTVLGMDKLDDNVTNTRGLSKFEVSPGKYGIEITKDSWTSTHLTKSEALSLMKEIEAHPKFQNMKDWGRFKWFGRALVLGYTLEQIFYWIRNNIPIDSVDPIIRSRYYKDRYYENLLKV